MNTHTSIDSLESGFQYLALILQNRLQQFLKPEEVRVLLYPKAFKGFQDDILLNLIERHSMKEHEVLMLLITMAPVFHPELLEVLISGVAKSKISPGLIGGITKEPSRTFIPTCRTINFILGEDEDVYSLYSPNHYLIKENIIELTTVAPGVPLLDTPIYVSEEYYHLFTSGKFEPRHSESFPARKIETQLCWEDLVIRHTTRTHIKELEGWIRHQKTIMSREGLATKIKRGYRALFYGPSGTGKTMTATLLGCTFNMPVYRVDLSMVVSKYVGETEKNLEKIFNMAESREWILFFDEAEAMFGRRGHGGTANDRYANQEISYLLQRIEDYDGILILASNKLFDIDEAFTRRFQSIIEFPEPNAEERFMLWNKTFDNTGFGFAPDVDIKKLADNHTVTGGMLVNVLRYCAIKLLDRGDNTINQEDLVSGLKKEYQKERKMWVETPLKTTVPRIQVKGRAN